MEMVMLNEAQVSKATRLTWWDRRTRQYFDKKFISFMVSNAKDGLKAQSLVTVSIGVYVQVAPKCLLYNMSTDMEQFLRNLFLNPYDENEALKFLQCLNLPSLSADDDKNLDIIERFLESSGILDEVEMVSP